MKRATKPKPGRMLKKKRLSTESKRKLWVSGVDQYGQYLGLELQDTGDTSMAGSPKGKVKLYAILDDNYNVVRTDDVLVWSKFFSTNKRFLAYEDRGNIKVSTVFIGVSYYDGREFETCLIKGIGKNTEYDVVATYGSYEEAMAGHKAIVKSLPMHLLLPEPEFDLDEITKSDALVRKAG